MSATDVVGLDTGPEIVRMTTTMVTEDPVEGQGHQEEEGTVKSHLKHLVLFGHQKWLCGRHLEK